MIEVIQVAIPLGFLMSFLIGPIFFVLLETSATKGFRAGVCFNIGAVIADVFFVLLAYFSSFQLLENLSNQPGLFVFGGMLLSIYGIMTFAKKPSISADTKASKGTYLSLTAKGFLLNFINVGVLLSWLGLLMIVGPSLNNHPNRIGTFFAVVIATSFSIDLVKILLAKQLKSYLTEERLVFVKKGLGFVLIVCGIVLITKGLLPQETFNLQEGIERIRE